MSEPVWGQQFYEPGLVEEHSVDFDPDHRRLIEFRRTYGDTLIYRGVKLYVRGCVSREESDTEMLRLIELQGWTLREHWWQFWRVSWPRQSA